MSDYDAEVVRLLKQIADDLRWLRSHAEKLEAEREQASEEAIRELQQNMKNLPPR